jgi:UDP-N-acetyl-D-mannosaminuronate dehydrogenase
MSKSYNVAVIGLGYVGLVIASPRAEETIAHFWRDTLGVDVIKMGSPIAAELVKLVDNVWIDVNIALANLVAVVAQSYGIEESHPTRSSKPPTASQRVRAM